MKRHWSLNRKFVLLFFSSHVYYKPLHIHALIIFKESDDENDVYMPIYILMNTYIFFLKLDNNKQQQMYCDCATAFMYE